MSPGASSAPARAEPRCVRPAGLACPGNGNSEPRWTVPVAAPPGVCALPLAVLPWQS